MQGGCKEEAGGQGARVSRMDEAKFSMGSVKRVSQFMSGHM